MNGGRGAGRLALQFFVALLLPLSGPAQSAPRLPDGFVYLRDVDPSIRQDMRYAGVNNFVGHLLPGYRAGECLLRRPVALALKAVQADLARQSLSLKVYDCYRPTRAVARMAQWADSPGAKPDTSRFYPGLKKANLFSLGYIASHSAHSRGVAIDLTVVPKDGPPPAPYDAHAQYGSCAGPVAQRAPDDSLDMGTSFDCFSVRSYTRNGSITAEQHARRQVLLNAMARHGFVNYKREWWHFSYPAADTRREYDFAIEAR
ncbi:MAG TPA: M15 family metallopeptidase [Pseudolabrys sp.]|nr:M15 family metallopeptidase [Pseudolabrys sp.]